MDELEISGKRYISSRRAAQDYKYHADYIGQLVRAKKVAGQKVGRAWYVDAESLAEYLGKEVPPRGPIEHKLKAKLVPEASGGLSIAEHVTSSEEAESEVRDIPLEQEFALPFRKSARQHVIAAIDTPPQKKEYRKEPVQEQEERPTGFTIKLVPEIESSYLIKEVHTPEETVIPVKISQDTLRIEHAEPEDSFYKVSGKSLRYVPNGIPVSAPFTPASRRSEARIPTKVSEKNTAKSGVLLLRMVSLVMLVGIVSLCAGALMAYYLHSVTTVEGEGQTSAVLLSQ